MIPHWPFWLGGIFLAAVPVLHWFLLHKMFAVSGRVSSLVDWLRGRRKTAPALDALSLIEAMQRETAAAFGEESVSSMGAEPPAAAPALPTPPGLLPHIVFLTSVAVGGTASAWLALGGPPRPSAPSGDFTRFFGSNPLIDAAVLLFGGMLVGFGTRMAGGCTSGHGLCGVSRMQPGSLVATACFFGFGIVVSFALQLLLGAR